MKNKKHPYKILLIEDEKQLRDNYVEYLEFYFDEVYQARDGEEGYKVYKKIKPHILIIDINIPKLNGIELLKKIRKTNHTIKAVMLTAHTEKEILIEASELKLTKYLVKPISNKDLNNTIEQVVLELITFKTSTIKQVALKDGYSWNYDKQELTQNNQTINLTNKEKKIFLLLISTPNKVFSNNEIIEEVWEFYSNNTIGSFKTTMKNLRKKLPEDTIRNIFGVGYKINK